MMSMNISIVDTEVPEDCGDGGKVSIDAGLLKAFDDDVTACSAF